jgi:hypothetical protein
LLAAFSPDYATARRRFQDAVRRLGWDIETYPIDAVGPQGELLAVDVARSPDTRASQAVVISSGLHGVEGFFGSAVQLTLLERWAAGPKPDPSVRCVLLHALNPYGFAWLRRVDAQNVDLNRNFLLDGEPFAGSSPGYAGLDGFLNPRGSPSRWQPYTLEALLTVARRGMPRLRQAIATGQYEFPRGLFYGGAEPSRTGLMLKNRLGSWLKECRSVIHLDFHTGLGAWGTGKLLLDYVPGEQQRRRLTTLFGPEAFETPESAGVPYTARGGLGRWCVTRNADRDYLFAYAEFGTYRPIQVLGRLRDENRTHHWTASEDPAWRHAKERLLEAFCPRSPIWRERVLERAVRLVERALAADA